VGYHGDGMNFHSNKAIVNVHKRQTYYATRLQFTVVALYLLASVLD